MIWSKRARRKGSIPRRSIIVSIRSSGDEKSSQNSLQGPEKAEKPREERKGNNISQPSPRAILNIFWHIFILKSFCTLGGEHSSEAQKKKRRKSADKMFLLWKIPTQRNV
jgi:hypothetical protein